MNRAATFGSTQDLDSIGRSLDRKVGLSYFERTQIVPDSLLERIAAGESNAVEEALDRFGALVWSLVRRQTSAGAEAEDLVQEIFIDVWRNAGRFDASRSSETTFVALLARRRIIDHWRRGQRRLDPVSLDEQLSEPTSNDFQQIEHATEASIASRAVADLPEGRRRVIRLSVLYGMSHQEISSLTQLQLGTVKSHLRRGLIAVRHALEGSQSTPEGRP